MDEILAFTGTLPRLAASAKEATSTKELAEKILVERVNGLV